MNNQSKLMDSGLNLQYITQINLLLTLLLTNDLFYSIYFYDDYKIYFQIKAQKSSIKFIRVLTK